MKYVLLVCAITIAGFMAYQEFKPVPPPPPPPPPPAILSEPAPVINEAEQAKILKSTEDQDPQVRWEAVLLLDKMKSPQAMPVIFHMLRKDLEAPLRIRAAELLGGRGGQDVTDALVGALKDQEPDVRLAALRAIEKIGDYSVAGVIATGPIKDQEESVRLQALKTLNTLQDKKQAEIDAARARYEQEKAAAAAAAAGK
ncbi:MAG: HEAT repeat domain-containing protein [Elusimicrobiota bacterium]|nr:HEAT repeat domain-containing protein [Elusimicrobiota bacterium]